MAVELWLVQCYSVPGPCNTYLGKEARWGTELNVQVATECPGKSERPGIVSYTGSQRGFMDSHRYGSYYLCFLKIEFGGKRGLPQSRANQDVGHPVSSRSIWLTLVGSEEGMCEDRHVLALNSLSITSLCETQAQMASLYRQQSLSSTCPTHFSGGLGERGIF